MRCIKIACIGYGEYNPGVGTIVSITCPHCHVTYICSSPCKWMKRYHNDGAHCAVAATSLPALLHPGTPPRPAWAHDETITLTSMLDFERTSGRTRVAPRCIVLGGRDALGDRGVAPWPLPGGSAPLSFGAGTILKPGVDAELRAAFFAGPQSNVLQLRARYDPASSTLWVVVVEAVGPAPVNDGYGGGLMARDIGPAKVRTTWVPFRSLRHVVMLRWGGLGLNPDFDHAGGNLLADPSTGTFGGPAVFRRGSKLDEKKILLEWVRERNMQQSQLV